VSTGYPFDVLYVRRQGGSGGVQGAATECGWNCDITDRFRICVCCGANRILRLCQVPIGACLASFVWGGGGWGGGSGLGVAPRGVTEKRERC